LHSDKCDRNANLGATSLVSARTDHWPRALSTARSSACALFIDS